MKGMRIGTRIESEHKGTYNKLQMYVRKHGHLPPKKEFYSSIAGEHIREYKNYYQKLPSFEKCLEKHKHRCRI